MAYTGSEATRLDAPERGRLTHSGPALEVVEGAGLDADARRGVSARFWGLWRASIVLVVCLACLFGVRVALLSAAVPVLSENSSMRSELKQAQDQIDGLQIERSVLASNSRVERIATQVYGMVKAGGTEQMDAADAASAPAEDPQTSDQADRDQQGASSEAAAADASQQSAQASATDISHAAQSACDGSAAGSIAADVDDPQGL